MKRRLAFISISALALFLALVPIAVASTTWYVDGVNGNDSNDCKSSTTACKSIGHAVSLASSGDSISVAAATYTENLTITRSLNIIGSRATTTIIDGGGLNSVVTIPNRAAEVVLSAITIRNGSASQGGGVNNSGALTINRSTISGNVAGAGGGAGMVNESQYSQITINNSTISENSTTGRGGGINNFGRLRIHNSTISGNTASEGGGINNNFGFVVTVNNGTISGNTALLDGAGLLNSGVAFLKDSIVAKNLGSSDCSNTDFLISQGYNLGGDNSCNFDNAGDLNNIDPELGPLQNNGGPTQTQALLSGSPAIDAGNPNGCKDGSGHLLKTDQRGAPRPDKEDSGGCDMGAYERQMD